MYDGAARFWARLLGITFAVGVVTGIPLEFQFGTNWAAFSNYAGGVIGQTLAMEGTFPFFAESSFIAFFLLGRGRVGDLPPHTPCRLRSDCRGTVSRIDRYLRASGALHARSA